VDLEAWAVIACDQYTSQPEYWRQVREVVGNKPSTLRLILPEAFLENTEREQAIDRIAGSMHEYLNGGVLRPQAPGFILVERHTRRPNPRHGLIVALDLEAYDFHRGAASLIRASEGTVVERLPPRAHIRERAPVEVPHVLVLIDDPERTVIEPLLKHNLPTVYDFDLMLGGGHITGKHVGGEQLLRGIAGNLARLASPELFQRRYGIGDHPPLLYAMGDGNHSFAAAKLVWERTKSGITDPQLLATHPARFAMVELVNVHDEGLTFEPIHRVVRGRSRDEFFDEMTTFYRGQGASLTVEAFDSYQTMQHQARQAVSRPGHHIGFVDGETHGLLSIAGPPNALPSETLQSYFDMREHAGQPVDIDYIHGDDALCRLAQAPGSIGLFLPSLPKSDLFRTIVLDGALPRKTFSLGEADEKRFYLECRRIEPQE